LEVKAIGPLRARIVRNTSESEGMTFVLLHGFGAPGDDLAGLAGMIPTPPGTTLVFPEALHDLADLAGPMYRGARAWWMIDFAKLEAAIITGAMRDLPNEIPEGLDDARAAVIAFLDALEKEEGISLDRLVLGGFSQGAMLALDVALHSSRELSGLVLLSGSYIAEREWKPRMSARKGTAVFQSHGATDPILPFALAEQLRDELVTAGLDVEFRRFSGGHGIPPNVMNELGLWLSSR
jgi:phospholipase/carboxylesterase